MIEFNQHSDYILSSDDREEHIELLEKMGYLIREPIPLQDQPVEDYDPYWTPRLMMSRRFKRTFS